MYVVNKKKQRKKKRHFIVVINFLIFFCLIIFVGLGINYIVSKAPTFDKKNLYMSQASIMLDKNGDEITRLGSEDRELVSYNDLPQVLVDAIVAAEDSRFF